MWRFDKGCRGIFLLHSDLVEKDVYKRQTSRSERLDFKRVNGGLLVQDADLGMVGVDDLKVVSKRQPTEQELKDLLFCWKVAKFVKSNAIVYAKDNQTIGIGAGQMSRVYSAKIAGIKAQDEGLTVAGCRCV